MEPVYDVGTYRSRCGRRWHGEPPESSERDHLECAIWANEQATSHWKKMILIMASIGLCGFIAKWAFANDTGYFTGLLETASAAFIGLFYIYDYYKFITLKEFIDKGTIRGKNAHVCDGMESSER